MRAMRLVHGFDEILACAIESMLELPAPCVGTGDLVLELDDLAHTNEAHTFVGELLDPPQQRDVAVGVPAAPSLRARRLDETLALIDPQRLRVHTGELRRDG